MIIISREGQPLEKIETWDDLFGRPKLQRDVNPKAVLLEDIIGYYRIPPVKHHCGLSSCHTPHFTGFLAQLGGGMETHIGKDCGNREFDVDFESLVRNFRVRLNAQKSRENIKEKQNRVEPTREAVEALRSGEFGADDLYKRMHREMTRLLDEKTSNRLKERAKADNPSVAKVRRLTEEEREDLQEIGDDREFEETEVFRIAGLRAVLNYPKLKTILNVRLGDELDAFEKLISDDMKHKDLRTWSNWGNRIDIRLKKARDIMEDCKRFLVPENIAQINKHKVLL